jgi:hypothetical protein
LFSCSILFNGCHIILVPKDKQPLQKCLGKTVDRSVGRITTDYDSAGVADFLGKFREIVP